MRQRLGIAQALLGRPRHVLLDEPLNGLDPEGIEEMRRLLHRLTREEGTTVLLSSHQLGEVAGLCNRIGILREGRLLLEDETRALLGGRDERFLLRSPDRAAAARALAAAGVASQERPDGTLALSLSGRAPAEVVKALVAAGAGIEAFGPEPRTLEEIYPACATGDAPTEAAARTPPDPPAPATDRRAAPRSDARASAHACAR